jgi:hypothetical protein
MFFAHTFTMSILINSLVDDSIFGWQLLKEYCDRHKWSQPVYEVTTVQPTGRIRVQQFRCKIVMQDQDPNFEESEIEVGIKIAKKNAAAAWIERLEHRRCPQ